VVKFETSVGGVIFKRNGEIKFLLVKVRDQKPDGVIKEWWEFPKGIKEHGERDLATLKREIQEETNLKDILVHSFIGETKYWFKDSETKETVKKTVRYYLVEYLSGDVRISWEHADYTWATFEEAMNLLKYKNHKDILKKAYAEIQKLQSESKQKTLEDFIMNKKNKA